MDDITSAILSAWEVVGPRLGDNQLELAKRLARRRLKTLRRPLRAWCVALRASDHRINPAIAAIVPQEAAYPHAHDPHHAYHPYDDHVVYLTAALLRKLCRPVRIDWPGEDWKDVARKLGVTKNALRQAMQSGRLQVHHVAGLGGQIGKPIPIVYSPHALDPSSHAIASSPDPVWCNAWQHVADLIPDDFEQPVRRVPRLRTMRTKTGPREVWRGWRWICPGCRKRAEIIYCPVKPVNLPEYLNFDPAEHEWDQIESPPMMFACFRCHGVRTYSRANKNSWNELIHHLSGGLLYGYEVEKPSWLTSGRKRRYVPKPGRAPSKRQQEVLDRLLRGWRDRQIAKDLGISFHRTRNLVAKVLKQHHAHGRKALIAMLRPAPEPTSPPASQTSAQPLYCSAHDNHSRRPKEDRPRLQRRT